MSEYFEYYMDAWYKYAEFGGRANRPQFWYFTLFNLLIIGVIALGGGDILSLLYSLVAVIPSVAIGTRRLHDIGKSGWMQLVGLIPFFGVVWLLILLAQESSKEDNEYGKYVVLASGTDAVSADSNTTVVQGSESDVAQKITDKQPTDTSIATDNEDE